MTEVLNKASRWGQSIADKATEPGTLKNISQPIMAYAGDVKNFLKGVFKYGVFNKSAAALVGEKGVREGAKAFLRGDTARLLKGTGGHIGLLIAVGSLAASVYAFASSLRTGKEGMDALKMRGNHMGSVWWSGAQAALHVSTIVTIAGLGVFAPGYLFVAPLLPLIPSALAIGMDYFQDVCTNPSNFLNKAGQFGLNNLMVDYRRADGSLGTYLPIMINVWEKNIRKGDEYLAKSLGFDLDRPDLLLPQEGIRPGWMI